MRTPAIVIVLAGVWVLGSSCIPRQKGGTSAGVASSADAKACPADGVIDDCEDNDHQAALKKGRSGYWYTFVDKAGSTITPTAGEQGGTFAMSPGGANGSQYAGRMQGKVNNGEIVFAGMGVNFVNPKGPYDASAYKGISFWAKKGSGASTGKVRLKVPDSNTDPDGKVCTECFNDFGADLDLTENWAKYVVPFSTMKQLAGWGAPHPSAITPSKLYGIQFQVNQPGANYEIWVDDLQFTGCP